MRKRRLLQSIVAIMIMLTMIFNYGEHIGYALLTDSNVTQDNFTDDGGGSSAGSIGNPNSGAGDGVNAGGTGGENKPTEVSGGTHFETNSWHFCYKMFVIDTKDMPRDALLEEHVVDGESCYVPVSNCATALDTMGKRTNEIYVAGESPTNPDNVVSSTFFNSQTLVYNKGTGYTPVGNRYRTRAQVLGFFGGETIGLTTDVAPGGKYDIKTSTDEGMADIIEWLGSNPSDFSLGDCVFVVEPYLVWQHNDSFNEDGSKKHYMYSYQQFITSESKSGAVEFFTYDMKAPKFSNDKVNKGYTWSVSLGGWHQQVFNGVYVEHLMTEDKKGFILYGRLVTDRIEDIPLVNTIIHYAGEPNTSDSSAFTARATLNDYTGSTIKYFDVTQGEEIRGQKAGKWITDLPVDTAFKVQDLNFDKHVIMLSGVNMLNFRKSLENQKVKHKEIDRELEHIENAEYSITWGKVPPDERGVPAGIPTYGGAWGITSLNAVPNSTIAVSEILRSNTMKMEDVNETGIKLEDIVSPDLPIMDKFAALAKAAQEAGVEEKFEEAGAYGTGVKDWVRLHVGHSICVTAKALPITSDIILINATTGELVSHDILKYDTSTYVTTGLPASAVAFVVASKESTTISSFTGISGAESASDALSLLEGCAGSVEDSGLSVPSNIALGSTETNKGYIVACAVISPPEDKEGFVELEDYNINKYFDDIINTSHQLAKETKGIPLQFGASANRYTTTTPNHTTCTYGSDCGCHSCTAPYSETFISSYEKDWAVKYKDISTGEVINGDAGNLLGRYLLKCNTSFGRVYRKYMTEDFKVSLDTKTDDAESFTKGLIFEYAFNFVRGLTNDRRTVSPISNESIASTTNDSRNILQMDFSDIPQMTTPATAIRSSKGKIGGTHYETLSFTSKFVNTDEPYGFYECITDGVCNITGDGGGGPHQGIRHTHTCSCGGCRPCPDGHWGSCRNPHCEYKGSYTIYDDCSDACPGHSHSIYGRCSSGHIYPCTDSTCYCPHPTHDCGVKHATASYHKYDVGGITRIYNDSLSGSGTTMSHTFNKVIYKYQTKNIPMGVNQNVSDGTLTLVTPATGAKKVSVGDIDNTNGYRHAYVKTHNGDNKTSDIELNYYPEVPMRYELTQKEEYNESEVTKDRVATMGEVKRKTEPSTLYLYRLKGAGHSATGTVYSDSLLSGNLAYNAGLPIIPAGSDVTMTTSASGVSLNLYGYALDIINKDKDALMKGSELSYRDVVKSGMDVYSDWANHGTTENLLKDFTNWVNEVTDVSRYQADITLKVGGSVNKEYNNFGTTIGFIQKNTIDEDGVYPLEVVNGSIVSNTSYIRLINQIADDYGVSPDVAEQLFEESGIFTAIKESIESSSSEYNNSQPSPDDVSLGNGTHWYDEEVRTFVIRRFKCENNKFNDIILTDKIDYGAAPTGMGRGINNNTTTAKAEWYLTIYFSDKNKKIDGITPKYDPANKSATTQMAVNNYSMIMQDIHVHNADFLVPNSTTGDFGN